MRARALSADFGISFSTVGCWAACGRLWAAIERHYVAKRCHMMLFGVIYTSRVLTGARGFSRSVGLDAPITIVNGAKFQGLREIWQKRAKTGGNLQFGNLFVTMSCWVAQRWQITVIGHHWTASATALGFLQG